MSDFLRVCGRCGAQVADARAEASHACIPADDESRAWREKGQRDEARVERASIASWLRERSSEMLSLAEDLERDAKP